MFAKIQSFALMIVLAAGAAFGAESHRYTFDSGDFTRLQVIDGINVNYICEPDSAGLVSFSCDPKTAPLLMVSNKNGTLKLQLEYNETQPRHLPTVTVRSKYLEQAENSGDSTLVIDSPAPGASIKLRVIGNGRIIAKGLHASSVEGKIDTGKGHLVLSGATVWAKLRTVGTGSIEAGGLKADKASIVIGGTGSVDCNVSDELTVTGLGSGKVYCIGSPQVKNRTLGTVKVIFVDRK